MDDVAQGPAYDPAAEVVELCRELIRIDTTNYGDREGPGERKAAEYVAGLLDEVGIESRIYEAEPGRASVVARWGGSARIVRACSCTAISTSCRRQPRTGQWTRSAARSRTATCGAAERST